MARRAFGLIQKVTSSLVNDFPVLGDRKELLLLVERRDGDFLVGERPPHKDPTEQAVEILGWQGRYSLLYLKLLHV